MYGFARNAVVVASAGTGKTHALVGMLVHTLLGETELGAVPPSRVVATTFSRRAAREIRARLARDLEALADAPDSSRYWSALQETRRARGLAPRSAESLAEGAREAARGAAEVFVGTLHGFALSLLSMFSLEVGRPGGIVVVDEADFRARANRAIARALEARAVEDGPSVRALVGLAGGIDALVSRLRAGLDRLPGVTLHGDPAHGNGTTVNAGFAGCDGQLLLINLDLAGFAVSTGAACSSGSLEPSPVLLALGLTPAAARSALRISFGKDSGDEDVDALLAALPELLARVRGASVDAAGWREVSV